MKILLSSIVYVAVCIPVSPITLYSQSLGDTLNIKPAALFDSDHVMEITIRGNLRELLNDRAETPQTHAISISYRQQDSTEITIPALGKTRGHFRRLKENCVYPPLLIHFIQNGSLPRSVFNGQDKIKLVMPCQGDEYVVREWLVYKLYSLLTPKSFRARLVKIKMDEGKGKKKRGTVLWHFPGRGKTNGKEKQCNRT